MEALKSLLRFLEGWGIGLEEKLVIIPITHSQISSNLEACLFLSVLQKRFAIAAHMRHLAPKRFLVRAEIQTQTSFSVVFSLHVLHRKQKQSVAIHCTLKKILLWSYH